MTARLKVYGEKKTSGLEWLGHVPSHWTVLRVKTIASVINGATPSSNTDSYWGGNVVWLTPQDLGALEGRCAFTSARRITPAGYDSCGATVAPAGSIAISTRAPIGHLAILGTRACTNQGCKLLVPKRTIRSDYLYYCLKVARSELESLGRGTTFAELSRDKLAGFRLAVAPQREQAAIVRFLDHADQRVRFYVRAKQKLIALLETQRQAIIHEAVTGRIDVRTGQPYPAYKDSGVEWLGAVPTHWGVWRSKRVFRPRTELARPDDIQLSATQAYGVIAQADYEEKIGRKVTKILRHLEQRRHVEVDDFVISMRSFQGGLERAWRSGCIRSSYIVLQAATTELSVGYFGHLFKSAGYIAALQSTANFIGDGQDLNFENFCRVDVPFPPIEEQHQIAHTVDTATTHIASRIERSRRQISSLREYRARLISDVVTGKVDVRDAAAGLPERDPLADEEHTDGDFRRHTGWEARGSAKDGGPLPHIVDTKRSGAVAGELMAEGR